MTDILTRLRGYNPPDRTSDFPAIATDISEAADEIERLRHALHSIDHWSQAYPLTVFPEPDFKKARELLEAGGMTLDSVSASNMRHVVEGVGSIARQYLGVTAQLRGVVVDPSAGRVR